MNPRSFSRLLAVIAYVVLFAAFVTSQSLVYRQQQLIREQQQTIYALQEALDLNSRDRFAAWGVRVRVPVADTGR